MQSVQFGNIGVCVEDFTKESLHAFLKSHYLDELLDSQYFKDSERRTRNMYLQAETVGSYTEDTTINIHGGYVRYVTDMDNFLHILRVGILDPDAASDLIEELYLQGLIKPRYSYETN